MLVSWRDRSYSFNCIYILNVSWYILSILKIGYKNPELEKIGEAILELGESGESPDRVGDIVFEAIKKDVFYIFTDTKLSFRRMIQTRNEEIMEAFKQNKQIHKSLEKSSEYK